MSPTETGLELSVVVCTRNRASYLARALRSLARQTLAPERYEVIVVDNGSTDDTAAVVRAATESTPDVRYHVEPEVGLSRARNAGWQVARGEIIAYLDDDAFAADGWAAAMLGAFAAFDPPPACVAGKVVPLWETVKPLWLEPSLVDPLGRSVDDGDGLTLLTHGTWAIGANMAFTRPALAEAGGFRPEFGYRGRKLVPAEESILQQELEDRGYTRAYQPAAAVSHLIGADRLKRSWFLRRYYWEGVAGASLSIERQGLTRSASIREALSQTAWLARSPGRVVSLVVPADDPESFLDRCPTSFRLGRIAAHLGISRP
jgi:glycosyltransferase involved in cell wall biosynthesis